MSIGVCFQGPWHAPHTSECVEIPPATSRFPNSNTMRVLENVSSIQVACVLYERGQFSNMYDSFHVREGEGHITFVRLSEHS